MWSCSARASFQRRCVSRHTVLRRARGRRSRRLAAQLRKSESRRRKPVSRRQKAGGRRQSKNLACFHCLLPSASCLLSFAFSLGESDNRRPIVSDTKDQV